jgi:hypothetical protein
MPFYNRLTYVCQESVVRGFGTMKVVRLCMFVCECISVGSFSESQFYNEWFFSCKHFKQFFITWGDFLQLELQAYQ